MKNRYKQAVNHKKRRPLSLQMRHRLREGLFLISIASAIFLLVSLVTFQAVDPGWSSTGLNNKVLNWGGRAGAFLSDIFLSLFGVMAYFIPFWMVLVSWFNLREKEAKEEIIYKKRYKFLKILGWVFFIGSCCTLASYYLTVPSHFPAKAGGMLGDLLGRGLSLLFNKTGSSLLAITGFLCGITLITGLSWLALAELMGEHVSRGWHSLHQRWRLYKQSKLSDLNNNCMVKSQVGIDTTIVPQNAPSIDYSQLSVNPKLTPERDKVSIIIPKPPILIQEEAPEKKKMILDARIPLGPGTIPPLTLLNSPSINAKKSFPDISFEELSQLVEHRLSDFGVEVKVVAVHPGPVITRFELELAPGIKVSKISGLAKDIARSLSTISVRIVDVIPGKSVIGLEIPNENRELVTLREMLESAAYIQSKSPVSLVLGKDISGNPIVVDLTKMPHLLVAGTTGSGKSVSLNAMLLSMLYKSTPEQLRLILIDPKMLELSVYDGIPHLLTPVITDMKDAANALRWCVAEMDKRYRLMSSLGVRNITGYNHKVIEAIKQGQPLLLDKTSNHSVLDEYDNDAKVYLEPLPIIVVIADELADMMMVVGKKVEDLIARIAQKARAAGIHLILATQRPSVDVITGLIKANVPTRIAFQVSSRIDSRTILDQQGAEQLLGHGDMLYLPPGLGVPIRVHGAYVEDEEVHRVVAAWRAYGSPLYMHEITEEVVDGNANGGDQDNESDPLYDEAVRIVTETRRASISLVQRRLRIGYNRAARMMEVMEATGVVSTLDTSGSREVLVAAPLE